MDSGLLAKLGEQAPYLVIIVILVFTFLNWFEKQELRRVENAKQLEEKREKHEVELENKREQHDRDMNNMWASYIKSIIDQQNATFRALMDALNDHEEASQKRYDKLGATQELINAVKERERNR